MTGESLLVHVPWINVSGIIYVQEFDNSHLWENEKNGLGVAGIPDSDILQAVLEHPPKRKPFAIVGESVKEVDDSPPVEPFL